MIATIARREIVARGRTRAYILTTVLVMVLAVGAVFLAVLFGDDGPREVTVGVVGELAPDVRAAVDAGSDADLVIGVRSGLSPGEVETLLDGQKLDVVVLDDRALLWSSNVDFQLASVLGGALRTEALLGGLEDAGLNRDGARQALAASTVTDELHDPPSDEDGVRAAVGAITAIASFIILQTYGSLVAMGVIEEKSSRVVEVLLSHVRPRQLLAGKVLGLGVLALVQATVLIAGLTAALSVTDTIDIPASVWQAIPVAVVWLILGFAFYAVMLGAAGSLVSRTEDAQQVILPVSLPLLLAYVFSVSTVTSPDTIVHRLLSYLPLTSPTVMPLRVAAGDVEAWEIGLSVLLLVVGIVVMTRFAARLYEFTLLATGSRITWRQALTLRFDQVEPEAVN